MNSSNWLPIIAVYPTPSVSVSVRLGQYLVSSDSVVINNRIPLKEHGQYARKHPLIKRWCSFTKDHVSSFGKLESLPASHHCQEGWNNTNTQIMNLTGPCFCQLLSPKRLLVPDTQWHRLSLQALVSVGTVCPEPVYCFWHLWHLSFNFPYCS